MNDKPLKKIYEPKYSLDVLKDFPKLTQWLNQICRYGNFANFVYIIDYKEKEKIRIRLFTKNYCYGIVACLPQKTLNECGENGYLGCVGVTRKPRAGEEWTRGNALPDGKYSEETWNRIKDGILAYEFVKVVRNFPEKREKKKK